MAIGRAMVAALPYFRRVSGNSGKRNSAAHGGSAGLAAPSGMFRAAITGLVSLFLAGLSGNDALALIAAVVNFSAIAVKVSTNVGC